MQTFGPLLRQWRQRRRMSQHALADHAEVSQRHLSRLETGKVSASRQMVLLLGSALDVPLRERNLMLSAAGFAPAYAEQDFDAPALEPVRRAVQFVLERSEPNPAIVVDRQWRLVGSNQAAMRLHQAFMEPTPSLMSVADNAMHALFHPDGLNRWLVNWPELCAMTLGELRRSATLDPEGAGVLLQELLRYPLPEPPPQRSQDVLVPLHLRRGDLDLRFALLVTTLGTPVDLTASELTIETYHAMDEATERWLRSTAPAPR